MCVCRSDVKLSSLPYVTYNTWAKTFYGEDALIEEQVNEIIAKEVIFIFIFSFGLIVLFRIYVCPKVEAEAETKKPQVSSPQVINNTFVNKFEFWILTDW